MEEKRVEETTERSASLIVAWHGWTMQVTSLAMKVEVIRIAQEEMLEDRGTVASLRPKRQTLDGPLLREEATEENLGAHLVVGFVAAVVPKALSQRHELQKQMTRH